VADAADPAPSFAAKRKQFLQGTASTLLLSRVHSVRELQGIVDDLGATINKLGDIWVELESANFLHARLNRLLEEDKREADAAIQKHSISPSGDDIPPFSAALSSVADMFMVKMDDDQ
jgi:hypothetical protein